MRMRTEGAERYGRRCLKPKHNQTTKTSVMPSTHFLSHAQTAWRLAANACRYTHIVFHFRNYLQIWNSNRSMRWCLRTGGGVRYRERVESVSDRHWCETAKRSGTSPGPELMTYHGRSCCWTGAFASILTNMARRGTSILLKCNTQKSLTISIIWMMLCDFLILIHREDGFSSSFSL